MCAVGNEPSSGYSAFGADTCGGLNPGCHLTTLGNTSAATPDLLVAHLYSGLHCSNLRTTRTAKAGLPRVALFLPIHRWAV